MKDWIKNGQGKLEVHRNMLRDGFAFQYQLCRSTAQYKLLSEGSLFLIQSSAAVNDTQAFLIYSS